ncbi:MAG: caspase family protein [Gammaproteobacteria bacterium]
MQINQCRPCRYCNPLNIIKQVQIRRVVYPFAVAALILSLGACSTVGQNLKGTSVALDKHEQSVVASVFSSPRRIALTIGINQFEDSQWQTLDFAGKDANDMASVLNDSRYGEFDEVITLTSPAETSKKDILDALTELAEKNLSQNDTVVFYISTHGTLARTDDGKLHQYLVTRDTRFSDIPNTALDVVDIKKQISRLTSQKKVMIIASCHSGKGKSQLNENMLAELSDLKSAFFVNPIEKVSEATIVLAASAWGEAAREDGKLKNDVYTHFLIEGIKKHDRNNDGAVTVTEAHDYAREQTYYLTKGEQRPSMESIILGTDPVVLSGRIERTGKPLIYDYSRHYEDLLVLVDGKKKGTLPLGVAVEPGAHLVEIKANDDAPVLYSEVFRAFEGDQISLPRLIHGYDKGLSLRLGYQGFLTEDADRSVAKPMPMLGMTYGHPGHFSPNLGFRYDLSYGQDRQRLDVGPVNAIADVSQTSLGVALVYRRDLSGMVVYGGPRLGALRITRKLEVANTPQEDSVSPALGGLIGLHFRYKQSVSFAIESNINYSNLKIREVDTNSVDYNVTASLSLNF